MQSVQLEYTECAAAIHRVCSCNIQSVQLQYTECAAAIHRACSRVCSWNKVATTSKFKSYYI